MKTKTVTPRSVGRPAVELNFNFGKRGFTVKDVLTRYAKNPAKLITPVAITQKLRRMIESGEKVDGKVMMIVGKKVVGRGRPFIVYKLVTPAEARKFAEAAAAVETVETETAPATEVEAPVAE